MSTNQTTNQPDTDSNSTNKSQQPQELETLASQVQDKNGRVLLSSHSFASSTSNMSGASPLHSLKSSSTHTDPFILSFLYKKIKVCQGCENKFCKNRILPKDLCIKHWESRVFQPKGSSITRKRYSYGYYHCRRRCLLCRWTNFHISQLDYSNVRSELEQKHKDHLFKEFEISLKILI